jgi:hypothetical protein
MGELRSGARVVQNSNTEEEVKVIGIEQAARSWLVTNESQARVVSAVWAAGSTGGSPLYDRGFKLGPASSFAAGCTPPMLPSRCSRRDSTI